MKEKEFQCLRFTSVSEICYKLEKVSDDTSSGDIVSVNDS